MRASWDDEKGPTHHVSPFVDCQCLPCDARRTATPQIRLDQGESELWLIDLGAGRNRLGGSALAHAYGQLGSISPDLDDPESLKGLFRAVRRLSREGRILAMHDRSDGGLLVTLLEMAFAGHTGLNVSVPKAKDHWRLSSAKSWGWFCRCEVVTSTRCFTSWRWKGWRTRSSVVYATAEQQIQIEWVTGVPWGGSSGLASSMGGDVCSTASPSRPPQMCEKEYDGLLIHKIRASAQY